MNKNDTMKWEDIYKVQKFLNRDLDRVTASTGLKKKEGIY